MKIGAVFVWDGLILPFLKGVPVRGRDFDPLPADLSSEALAEEEDFVCPL